MKNIISSIKENFTQLYLGILTTVVSSNTALISAQASDVEGRINNALSQIQNILTGLIVTVGIIVSLFIIIKRMPSSDNPQERQEVQKSLTRVLGLVAFGAAVVWIVPWVYSLFQ